ncbi:hypothetical protein JVU11DRAFT_3043 [Chiua virens]|nr:hypothetical protein JVU11DRAFT_3043 [Chiua virens]
MQATTIQRRSSTFTAGPPPLHSFSGDLFSDSRFHGYQGPSRNVRLPRATTSAGGTIAKNEDGTKCVVAGRESLRILRLLYPEDTSVMEQTPAVGRGGHRVESSNNIWEGSGLKIESASTDVAWCSGNYNNKVLTSARNGDLIMWDLDKPGSTKYERKTKNHIRSIHKLSCSSIVPYYCITGSADGDMRIWDLRDMSRSVMKIHHPTSVRSLVFSPSLSHPLQAVVGLDNGSIYRWDLQMGQRGQLDRLPMAHTSPILALDWCSTVTNKAADNVPTQMERCWIVSGGLDHTVKIWDLLGTNTSSHIVNKPKYILHPSYPVRRVLWRPGYPCELALVSNAEFSGSGGGGGGAELLASPRLQNATPNFISAVAPISQSKNAECKYGLAGETVEIWDVRRGWIAKWTVDTSAPDGGVTDAVFRDSHALFAQHASGTFTQVDLRYSHPPIDAVPRVALSWNAVDGVDGALAFVADKRRRWEVPYDDIHPDRRSLLIDRRSRLKKLGDKSRVPSLQNMGMYVRVPPSEGAEPDVFVRLAKGYVVPEEPEKKKEVCASNAEVALQAGSIHAAQTWILLGSLLVDIVPESVTTSLPAKVDHLPLVHSASTPGVLSNEGAKAHSPGPVSKPASYRALSADSAAVSPLHSPSQSRIGHYHNHAQASRSASVSGTSPVKPTSNEDHKHVRHRPEIHPPLTKPPPNSRNLTPVSSASSSPRQVPVSLPPTPALPPTTTMTPTTAGQRRPSILVSTASLVHSHVRRPSIYSRVASAHSESPSAASVSDKSLRHVGEGALDDSDSSDSAISDSVADSHTNEDHTDIVFMSKPILAKSRSLSAGRVGPAHPSPLSRLAVQQQWTETEDEDEDEGTPPVPVPVSMLGRRAEDDDGSPSPVSSDSDGERSEESEEEVRRRHKAMRTKSRSRSRKGSVHARRMKSQIQSSMVASLAAPLVSPASVRSSPREVPAGSPTRGGIGRKGSQSSIQTVIAASMREQENELVESGREVVSEKEPVMWAEMSLQRRVEVVEEERQLREAGWRALREALEGYADEGDIQMCAMLALVAPEELQLNLGRTIQFVEAYVDMLVRHRLHTCAAYLRKYSRVEDVQKTTRLETVIYTACRKCRKPVVAVRSRNPSIRATHAICATCKQAVARCAICHLPVRTLLFRCSVCSHGGHQDCYRRYYMARPMVELAAPLMTRGRQLQREREQDGENETEGSRGTSEKARERGFAGHPCAAGCGHFCWAAVCQRSDDEE